MKILIASPYLPWPLNAGGKVAQFATLASFKGEHEFTLLCPAYSEQDIADAAEAERRLPGVRVKTVPCWSPPPPKSSLLRRSVRALRRWADSLRGRGLEKAVIAEGGLIYPFDPLPEPYLTALLEECAKGCDLFQVEFIQFLPLGAVLPSGMAKLFIHHQIHAVYAERYLATHGRTPYGNYLERIMAVQERAFLECFDGVITFSDPDRAVLTRWLPEDRVFASPFPLPADHEVAGTAERTFNGTFVFLASQDNPPNADALAWLLEEIWPLIRRELPSALLQVIGNWSDEVRQRDPAELVEFTGFVEDLAASLRGTIMLVPLRVGSGIRVKIMTAMAQGTPVVSTAVGCEGLRVRDGEDLLIRDEPSEFAAAAVALAQDEAGWLRMAEEGLRTIVRHYAPEQVREERNRIYRLLLDANLQRTV